VNYEDYTIPFKHSIDELGYITFTFKLSAGDMQNMDCLMACLNRVGVMAYNAVEEYIRALRKDGKL
jgi:hypothetical protein